MRMTSTLLAMALERNARNGKGRADTGGPVGMVGAAMGADVDPPPPGTGCAVGLGDGAVVAGSGQHSRPCDCVPSSEHWGLVSPPDPSATHTAGRLGFLEFWQDEEVHTRFVLSWQGSPERLPATISLRVHKRPPWLAH
jgi:hypothetical protein